MVSMLLGAGLRQRVRSWIGVAALLAIASAAVASGLTVRGGTEAALRSSIRKAGAPDLVLWGRADALERASLDRAIRLAGTPRAIMGAELVKGEGTSLTVLEEIADENDPVNRVALSSGRRPLDGEAVVEAGTAKLGEQLQLRTGGKLHRVVVVGIGIDLSMCGSPTCTPGRIFVGAQTFGALTGYPPALSDQAQAFALHPADAPNADAVGNRLLGSQPKGLHRSIPWATTRSSILGPDTYLGVFISGIGGFLLLSALVVVSAVTTARLANRRQEFATYAALGVSPQGLGFMLIAEQVVVGVLGACAGWAVAGALVPWTSALSSAATAESTPMSWPVVDLLRVVAVVVLGLLLATGTAVLRISRTAPASALRSDPSFGRPRWRTAFRLPGVALPLGVQDPATRPVRSLLCLVGLTIATAGLVVGIGVTRSVEAMIDPSARPSPRRDLSLWAVDARTSDQLLEAIADVDGVDRVYTERSDAGSARGRRFTAFAERVPSGWSPVAVVHGRAPRAADEALLGTALTGRDGWRIGDRMTMRVRGVDVQLRIVGTFRDLSTGGAAVRYSLDALRAATDSPLLNAGTVQVVADATTPPPVLRSRIQRKLGPNAPVFQAGDPTWLGSRTRTAVSVTVALLLAVALAQLASAWLTTLREQRRDLLVLRALGSTDGQLMGRGSIGALLVAIGGVIAGVPTGLVVLWVIGRSTASRGLGPEAVQFPGPSAWAVAAVIICALSIVAAAATTAKALAETNLAPLRTT